MTEDQQQAAAAATQEPATAAASHPPAPDRLSNNPRSEFFDMDILQRGIGISFNGKQRHDVEEYCVSEGWIKVAAGKSRPLWQSDDDHAQGPGRGLDRDRRRRRRLMRPQRQRSAWLPVVILLSHFAA